MDRGAWQATVHVITRIRTQLSVSQTYPPPPHTPSLPPCPATSFYTKARVWSSPDLGHLYLAHSSQPHMLGEACVSLS